MLVVGQPGLFDIPKEGPADPAWPSKENSLKEWKGNESSPKKKQFEKPVGFPGETASGKGHMGRSYRSLEFGFKRADDLGKRGGAVGS